MVSNLNTLYLAFFGALGKVVPFERTVVNSSFQWTYKVTQKPEPLHFSCIPCIVAELRSDFSSSLQSFWLSSKFFVTLTDSELFGENRFGATNFQISENA